MKNGNYIEFNRSVWYLDDLIHRDDGPAVEHCEGYFRKWYKFGELHREDGPAIIESNGNEEWYFNGLLHNENGPAVVNRLGDREWWINGLQFSQEQFNFYQQSKQHHAKNKI